MTHSFFLESYESDCWKGCLLESYIGVFLDYTVQLKHSQRKYTHTPREGRTGIKLNFQMESVPLLSL